MEAAVLLRDFGAAGKREVRAPRRDTADPRTWTAQRRTSKEILGARVGHGDVLA